MNVHQKKRSLLVVICILSAIGMYAEKVTEYQALQKAQKILSGKTFNITAASRSTKSVEENNAYYVFNAENNDGFVIVSGDSRMTEILGYSESGSFNLSEAPDNVKWWLGQCEKVYNSLDIQSSRQVRKGISKAQEVKVDIAPFMTTTWGQGYPYNELCPQIEGTRCLTGCVATSMAQVIYYTQCPEGTTGEIAGYTTKTNQIAMPKLDATTFDWGNMTDADIARLMLYCGQAVKMDYGTDASGAYVQGIPSAMMSKFGYDNNLRLVFRDAYQLSDWEDLIYNELKEGRPVLYSGFSNNMGHSFVCHGYKDGMFYINWGWDGLFDGYFSLLSLTPGDTKSYTRDQTAIIGIQKSTGESAVNYPQVIISQLSIDGAMEVQRASADDNFSDVIVNGTLKSAYESSKTVQVGYALYQGNDFIQILSSQNAEFYPEEAITANATLSFGKDLDDGSYRIVAVYRENQESAWIMDDGANYHYVKATIEGNTLSLKIMPSSVLDPRLKFTVIAEGEVEVSAANTDIEGDIVIPEAVEIDGITHVVMRVAHSGFMNCEKITSLIMPSTMRDWLYNAFAFCKNLTTITIPRDLRIGIAFAGMFEGCENLTEIQVEEGNKYFKVVNGALLNMDETLMIDYAGGLTTKDYVIPESVKTLEERVFASNTKLETVRINNQISNIPYYAFYGCTVLRTVHLTENVTHLRAESFRNSSIQELILPENLVAIEQTAFADCKNLTEITFPSSLQSIGMLAFAGCDNLNSIICKMGSPIAINTNVFSWGDNKDVIYKNATLYVPTGRARFFRQSAGWNNFEHIEEIDMPDVEISDDPFDNIEEDQMILGYYRGNEYLQEGKGGFGGNLKGVYKACIGFPKESIAAFTGCEIEHARFALTSTDISDVKFWIGSSRDRQDLCLQEVNDIKTGWNVITLDQPYTITGDSIFIGIEYFLDTSSYPLSYLWQVGYEKGSAYLYGPYGEDGEFCWIDYGGYKAPAAGYSLSLQCIIKGDIPLYDYHIYGGYPNSNSDKYLRCGDLFEWGISMRNWGKYAIQGDCCFSLIIDGDEVQTVTKEFNIGHDSNEGVGISFPIPEDIAVGCHDVKVSIKSINGETPKYPADDTASGVLKIYTQEMERQKNLMQYYTATWCPFTTHKYNYQYKKEHPEYALISIYGGDDLQSPVGLEYWNLNPGGSVGIIGFDRYFPNHTRTLIGDTHMQLRKNPSFANVNIEGDYNKETRELGITVRGQRTNELALLHNDVNLSVFLTEDAVICPQFDTDLGQWIQDFKHKGVLRTNVSAIWGDPISWDGNNYEMHYSIKLKDEWCAEKMHVIAFIGEPFDGDNFDDINVINCNDYLVRDAIPIEIEPMKDAKDIAFALSLDDEFDLNNTVIENTYYSLNSDNGDLYDEDKQAIILNSTTSDAQMTSISNYDVGANALSENFNGIIIEVPAGDGTVTVDAQTIGTHLLNVKVGNNEPVQVTKSSRGTVDVRYCVNEPTYVYIYASAEVSASRRSKATTSIDNYLMLYGYKVKSDDPGDANADGRISVTDIGVVVNSILQLPNDSYSGTGADANCDGHVTVTDIGTITDLILGTSNNARANEYKTIEPQ